MRNLVLGGVTALTLGLVGGFWWWWPESTVVDNPIPTPQSVPTLTPPIEQSVVGEVTAVVQQSSSSPFFFTVVAAGSGEAVTVAVPTMDLIQCVAAARIANPSLVAPGDRVEVRGQLVGSEIVPCRATDHYFNVTRTEVKQKLLISFTYRKGPHGYVLEENTLNSNTPKAPLRYSAVFTDAEEYAEFLNATEPRDGPETFSLRVYQNTESLPPLLWAETYPKESNFPLRQGEVTEATVSTANAIRYTIDGLYLETVTIAAHGDNMYVFAGPTSASGQEKADTFTAFLEHVSFLLIEGEARP